MLTHDERSHARPISLGHVGHLYVPANTAVFRVERDQMSIGRQKEQISLVHRDTAMPDVFARTPRMDVMPYLMAGPGIDGPDIFRDGKVENAIHQQRRRLDQRCLVGLEGPS